MYPIRHYWTQKIIQIYMELIPIGLQHTSADCWYWKQFSCTPFILWFWKKWAIGLFFGLDEVRWIILPCSVCQNKPQATCVSTHPSMENGGEICFPGILLQTVNPPESSFSGLFISMHYYELKAVLKMSLC